MKKLLQVAMLVGALSAQAFAFDMNARLLTVTEKYVGTHYVLDPFGEGETGKYDRDPLYRFDAFDCTTFVETSMALALSRDGDFDQFFHTLQAIRYRDGVIGYTTRNHFPEVDWIPNNTRAGFVRDITVEVAGPFGAETAEALIEKRAWYEHMKLDKINVPGASEPERKHLLAELQHEGRAYGSELSRMPYIAISTLFTADGKPNEELFARIPPGSLMNVVRPNWDMTATEGTHLNVSHQALIVKKADGELYMRHATTGSFWRVVDQPLKAYLRNLVGHPTIKGINLLELRAAR